MMLLISLCIISVAMSARVGLGDAMSPGVRRLHSRWRVWYKTLSCSTVEEWYVEDALQRAKPLDVHVHGIVRDKWHSVLGQAAPSVLPPSESESHVQYVLA